MSLQSFVQRLLPKNDIFFELLQKQAGVLVEACEALQALIQQVPTQANQASMAAQLEHIHDLEHKGDDFTHSVLLTLEKNFFAPLDREDVRMLTKQLDEALDQIYEVALVFCTYGIKVPSNAAAPMTTLLLQATLEVQESLTALTVANFEIVNRHRGSLSSLERQADLLYREAMALLYCDDNVSAKELLRHHAMLWALESAMNSCHSISDALQNVTVKQA